MGYLELQAPPILSPCRYTFRWCLPTISTVCSNSPETLLTLAGFWQVYGASTVPPYILWPHGWFFPVACEALFEWISWDRSHIAHHRHPSHRDLSSTFYSGDWSNSWPSVYWYRLQACQWFDWQPADNVLCGMLGHSDTDFQLFSSCRQAGIASLLLADQCRDLPPSSALQRFHLAVLFRASWILVCTAIACLWRYILVRSIIQHFLGILFLQVFFGNRALVPEATIVICPTPNAPSDYFFQIIYGILSYLIYPFPSPL